MIHRILLSALCLWASACFARADGPAASDKQRDEPRKQLKESLGVFPVTPNVAADKVQAAKDSFRRFLAAKGAHVPEAADTLATSLARGINGGSISVAQTMDIGEAIAQYLDQPVISDSDMRAFTARIDPLVQGMNLTSSGRVRIYREALWVLQTSPNYVPSGR